MKLKWLLPVFALLCGSAQSVCAYSYMSIAGNCVSPSWDPSANQLTRTGDTNVWTGRVTFTAASGEFKFVSEKNWSKDNWGDPSLTIDHFPATDVGPLQLGGDNVKISGLEAGATYEVTFNSRTAVFSIRPVYRYMAIAGDCVSPEWTPSANLLAQTADEDVWSGRVTFTADSGVFKFVADKEWTKGNWGDASLAIARLPATGIGPLAAGGDNIPVSGLEAGKAYDVTFDSRAAVFSIEPVSATPPAVTGVQFIGEFNDGGVLTNGIMSRDGSDANLWKVSGLSLGTLGSGFQFLVTTAAGTEEWGTAAAETFRIETNAPVSGCAAGSAGFALEGLGGTFDVTLDTARNVFTGTQTEGREYNVDYVAAGGTFVANGGQLVNMIPMGSRQWRSEHFVTNDGRASATLQFTGCDADGTPAKYWTSTSTNALTPPVNGTMAEAASREEVRPAVLNNLPGRYLLYFNEKTGAFTYSRIYLASESINLLKNPSFEASEEAWGQRVPSQWNRWPRSDYIRAVDSGSGYPVHSGTNACAIQRLWDDWETYAGFDQDVAVDAGKGSLLRVSSYVRRMGEVSAGLVQIQVEWRDASGTNLFTEAANIAAPGERWELVVLEAGVPAEAATAHVVFRVTDIEGGGAFLFDDVEAKYAASRTQNFDAWGEIRSPQYIANDWTVSRGTTVWNTPADAIYGTMLLAKVVEGSDNNKAVEIFNGTKNDVNLSGWYLDQYDNGSASPTVSIALAGKVSSLSSHVVARPPEEPLPPAQSLSAAANQTDAALTFNGDDVLVLRNGSTVVDRMGQAGEGATGSYWSFCSRDHTLVRRNGVTNGNKAAVSSAFDLSEWDVWEKDDFTDLGKHSFSDNPDGEFIPTGYSLQLQPDAHLISGELSGGAGAVFFWARTETTNSDETIVVESSSDTTANLYPEQATWKTNDVLTILCKGTQFRLYSADVGAADALFVRLRHVRSSSTANRVRLDDITIDEYSASKRLQKFSGWASGATNSGTWTRNGWTITDGAIVPAGGNGGSACARINPANGWVSSPDLSGGCGETTFWAQIDPAYGADSNTVVALKFQISADGGATWTDFGSGCEVGTEASTFSGYVYETDTTRIRILYADGNNDVPVLLDDIRVQTPAYYPSQNFDSWPQKTAYDKGTAEWQGWEVWKATVTTDGGRNGTYGARMRDTVGDHAWLRSGYIPDGVANVSFDVQTKADGKPTYKLEFSADGSSWTTAKTYTFTNTEFQTFRYYNTGSNGYHYVRWYHDSGAAWLNIDNVSIGEPTPGASVTVSAWTEPGVISIAESVTLNATVLGKYDAEILSVEGLWSLGAGATQVVAMAENGYANYVSAEAFGPYSPGTRIDYAVKVVFAGVGADGTYATNTYVSPVQTTGISALAEGSVWINEIFYIQHQDDFDEWTWEFAQNHEFVEICGLAGTDISGWKIELAFGADADIIRNGNQAVYATYVVPSNTVLGTGNSPVSTNGSHGFYVFGDQELEDAGESVQQVLDTFVPEAVEPDAAYFKNHVHDGVGVVRLLDNYGFQVQSISYGGQALGGAAYINASQQPDTTNSLSVTGRGTYAGDFPSKWSSTTAITIGEENVGEDLQALTVNFANVWHNPAAVVVPVRSDIVNPFTMRSPSDAAMWDPVQIVWGYDTAQLGNSGPEGTLYYRNQKETGWKTIQMRLMDNSEDAAGHRYYVATIPAYTYPRCDTLHYYMAVRPNKGNYDNAWLGDAGGAVSTNFATEAEARANPFVYTFPFADPVELHDITVEEDGTVSFCTTGNDPVWPITNFTVRSTAAVTNPPETWATNSFVHEAGEDGIDYFYDVRPVDNGAFYRLDLHWP